MKIIEVSDTDLVEIEGNRHRTFQAISTPLTADVILNDIQSHRRQRVIVICNTVSQSQGLFQDLTQINHTETLNVTLLHSRFLPEHRAQKEAEIQANFSENWQDDGQCYLLIATQVIEAGLNITCEVMHTELAPMNSLLQRAGRCARFKGERGEAYVYWQIKINSELGELAQSDLELETAEVTPEKKSFLPYNKELCQNTWQVLQSHNQSELAHENVGFKLEQDWINQVHLVADLLENEKRKNDRSEFERKFNDAIFKGNREWADDLIRSVDNRNLFIWNEPTIIDFDDSVQIDPKKLLPFSVPLTTLCKVWQEVKNLGYETDWIFKRIAYPEKKGSETYALPSYPRIHSYNELQSSFQILVNPRYVYYDEEVGLQLGVKITGNRFFSPNKPMKMAVSEYQYQMDTYVAHLGCMWQCWRNPFATKVLKNGVLVDIKYLSVRDELQKVGGQFIQQKIFPNATSDDTAALFEYLVMLAIFTHDLGKLQQKWQSVMRGWQSIAYRDFQGKSPKSFLLAHTDYNPGGKAQKDALKAYEKQHKRPNHAVESAFLAQYILGQYLAPLLGEYFSATSEQISGVAYTILLAAGRHHSAWAKGWEMKDVSQIKEIVLHPGANSAIAASWRSLVRFLPDSLSLPAGTPIFSQSRYQVREIDLNKFSNTEIDYLHLYSLVVRALRLCDMRSVQL
ncbi:CRISPR-associated helicase Cas3' [Kamptonema sp. UHCC 0994]|uniref:CRISPR-associated helicase Cas3' n=1 Tax=Kamptonema sp. UHCC 0994 TaxID=3031329 RepID=UPI0023BA81CC|nr:CRISPR-associated helicase Cas3' [Kamptonema sp. UHCC 0994]MDF0556443.1 CRISPR-associated helicase Cas3' [Kamptonema sp. UHCC 0994]